jgi:hypothetical protein
LAAKKNITIEQGSTFDLPFTIYNSDGTPFNLTNWGTVRGQIRRRYRSTSIIASFTCTVVSALLGQIDITLSPTVTKDIVAGDTSTDSRSIYVYDIEIENTINGQVKRILNGQVFVSPEVTK